MGDMKIAKSVNAVIESLEKLPGIGPKTAQRLGFYLLRVPQTDLEDFAEALTNLKKNTKLCSVCKNVGETDPCGICSDASRDNSLVMAIEEPLDILAIERSSKFKGVYHVLHGAINPLENIGPDELYIGSLLERLKLTNGHTIEEVIIATNPTMEGEATAMYITKKIKDLPRRKAGQNHIKVTRLGMGIPTGADLGYADEATLTQAILGRREL